jgi:hypothetical protein
MAAGVLYRNAKVGSAVLFSTSQVTAGSASTVTSVTVTPSTATLAGGATIDFDWVIAGTNSPSQAATVTTSIGAITSAGVLTAPAATASVQTGTVTVTSTQDPTKSGTATFTVTAVQPADTTGPVMQGVISFTKTSTTTDLAWPAAIDANAIEYFVSKDGGTPVSTGTTRAKSFSGLAPASTHQYAVTARDAAGNPSSNSLSVTVTTDATAPVYATYVQEVFESRAGVPWANLTGMRWYFFDQVWPAPLLAPVAQGAVETTDGVAVGYFDIAGLTSLLPGQKGTLAYSNTNGDPDQADLMSVFTPVYVR